MDKGDLVKSPGIDNDQYSQKRNFFHLETKTSSTTLHNTADKDNDEVGLSHWLKTRRNFTLDHKPYNPKANAEFEYKKHAILADVEPGHFDTIYHSLITGRKFQHPMPLSFVMLVIIHGWRKEGLVSNSNTVTHFLCASFIVKLRQWGLQLTLRLLSTQYNTDSDIVRIYASAVSLEVFKHPSDVSDPGLYDTIGVDENGVLGEYKRKMAESSVIGWSAFRIANTLRIFLISRSSNLTSIINPIKSSNKFNYIGSIRLASETSSEFLIIICIIKTNIQFNEGS